MAFVTGLFPAEGTKTLQNAAASAHYPAPQVPSEQQTMVVDAPPTQGIAGKRRDLKWFVICSIVLLVLALLRVALGLGSFALILRAVGSGASPDPGTLGAYLSFTLFGWVISLVSLGTVVGLYVYFLVWVYFVHEEMARYTNGTYPISPGQALGFCFIPFFNAGWFVYMPYKLAEYVDQRFGSTQQITSPSSVVVFQILQQVLNVPCLCVFTFSPIFVALAIYSIQNGLNALWAASGVPQTQPAGAQIGARSSVQAPSAPTPNLGMPKWAWGLIGGLSLAAAIVFVLMIVAWVGPFFVRARETANRVKIASEMNQVGIAIRQYAMHNGGQFPANIADVVAKESLPPELLISPDAADTVAPGSTPQQRAAAVGAGGHCSFVYAGAGLTLQTVGPRSVLLFEAGDPHSGAGMNVLFGDGHVEFVSAARAQQIIAQPPSVQITAPPSGPSAPGLTGASTGLLSQIDPINGARGGTWNITETGVRSSGHGLEILSIPGKLPEEYDLALDFVRLSGTQELGVKLRSGSTAFMFLVGAARDTRMAIDGMPRNRANSPATPPHPLTPTGTLHHLSIAVRSNSLEAKLDDREVLRINGDFSKLRLPARWHAAADDPLDLASVNSSFEFRSLTVTPVGGQ